jgi:hypothetical protein
MGMNSLGKILIHYFVFIGVFPILGAKKFSLVFPILGAQKISFGIGGIRYTIFYNPISREFISTFHYDFSNFCRHFSNSFDT